MDVMNCLRFLNAGGVIVMHDCYPASEAEACPCEAEAKKMPGFDGNWTGDVWKTIVHLRAARDDINIFVLDADHGAGILTREKNESQINMNIEHIKDLTFSDLRKDPQGLINLKPASWFAQWLEKRKLSA